MPKTHISRSYNIPEGIIVEAERIGLDALSTGGNMDYIYKRVGINEDSSARIALLCDAKDSGGPDRLSDPVEVQIMLSEDWTNVVAIPAKNAKEGMLIMRDIYDPYKA